MALQKLRGVAIFMSLQECGFQEDNLAQGNQLWRVTGQQ